MSGQFTVQPEDLVRAEQDLRSLKADPVSGAQMTTDVDFEAILLPEAAAAVTSFAVAAADLIIEAQRLVPAMAAGLHATAKLYHVSDRLPGVQPR